MRYLLCLPIVVALLCGCDDDEETNDDDPGFLDGYGPMELTPGNIRALATSSAPNIFTIGIVIAAVPSLQNDPSCPIVTETPTETTYEGGCTTMEGTVIVGKAIMRESADGDATIEYLGWGFGERLDCQGAPVENLATYTGAMQYDKTGVGAASFSLQMELEAKGADPQSCATFSSTAAYDYAGSFVGSESAEGSIDLQQKTTWQGAGQVGIALLGKVDLATADEVVDGTACEFEAISGTTTLSSAGDSAVIRYDGASDCDMESTVGWSLNGVDQGELTGIRCSASPYRSAGSTSLFCLGLVLLSGLRRRRT